jgi:RNA polymerase sigma factor (sigma-70 family)
MTEAATTSSQTPLRPALLPAGDRKAVGREVGRLFAEHGRMVFALCNVLLRDRPEAEDATQQSFLSAHKSMLAGVSPADPAAWLAAIARNECLTRLRRRRLDTVALRDEDILNGEDVADAVERRAEIAALSEAIAGLPPAQRQAVVLRDFYGLSYREVSIALGVTGPAVESLLFKSRKRLQERLRPFRAAGGMAAVPATVRDALARAIPGFSNGVSGTGAGGAALTTKLLSGQAAAKVAAVALATGAGALALTGEPARLLQSAPALPASHVVVRGPDVPIARPVHDIPLIRPTEALAPAPKPKVVHQAPVQAPPPAPVTQTVAAPVVTAPPKRVVAAPAPSPIPTPAPVVGAPTVTVQQAAAPVTKGRQPDDPPLPDDMSPTPAPPTTTVTPRPTESHDDRPEPSSVPGSTVPSANNGGGDTTPTTTTTTTTTPTTTTTAATTTVSSSDDGGGHDGGDRGGTSGRDGGNTTTTTTTTSGGGGG